MVDRLEDRRLESKNNRYRNRKIDTESKYKRTNKSIAYAFY